LLALLGAHHILHISGIRVNIHQDIHGWILGLRRHNIHIGHGPYWAFYPVGNGAIISAANWLQHETDHSAWTYSEVRNAQSFILIPIHAFSLVLWYKRNITTNLFSTDTKTRSNGKCMRLLEGIYSLCKLLTQKCHTCSAVTVLMIVTHWHNECGSSLYKHCKTRFMYSGSRNV
jgi:hypothetical protein